MLARLLFVCCAVVPVLCFAQPQPTVFITEVRADWDSARPVLTIQVVGNHEQTIRDSLCPPDSIRGFYIDAKNVRIILEDSEGRVCQVKHLSMPGISSAPTERLQAITTVEFVADDGGAPRLPIKGTFTIRLHETDPGCEVDQHIVHNIQVQVNSNESGWVENYRSNYMAITED